MGLYLHQTLGIQWPPKQFKKKVLYHHLTFKISTQLTSLTLGDNSKVLVHCIVIQKHVYHKLALAKTRLQKQGMILKTQLKLLCYRAKFKLM